MAIKRPTVDQLQEVALSLGIHLSTEQAGVYNTLLQGNFDAYDVIDALPDYVPLVTYPRTPGYRPSAEENKYGAWYVKTIVKGSATGKLAGKTVVLKDNICLAGVPMMTAPNDFYYQALETRLPGHGEPVADLQARGILLDGSTSGGEKRLLLQIFSETMLGPVFFEFIQRKADEGFGEGNFKALFESLERDQIRRGALEVPESAES